jgi:hypothetical protein
VKGSNGYAKDRAVRSIKRLPKNRNVPVQRATYRCMFCPGFETKSLAEAWLHTHDHGPWPVKESGALAPLPTRASPLYNNGMRILALTDAPNIRRLV